MGTQSFVYAKNSCYTRKLNKNGKTVVTSESILQNSQTGKEMVRLEKIIFRIWKNGDEKKSTLNSPTQVQDPVPQLYAQYEWQPFEHVMADPNWNKTLTRKETCLCKHKVT